LSYSYTTDQMNTAHDSEYSDKKDIRRDNDATRDRCAVAHYKGFAAHALGEPNGVSGNLDGAVVGDTEVYQGFTLDVRHGPATDLGEFADLFLVGPVATGDVCLTSALKAHRTSVARGKLDLCGGLAASPAAYPDVPWAAALAEILEIVTPYDVDDADTNPADRIYGRVNVNAAPADVLKHLPWPAAVNVAGVDYVVNVDDLVAYIVGYRDKQAVAGGPDYSDRATATGITGLRADANSDVGGFFTPAELAIPLADYVDTALLDLATNPDRAKLAGYIEARNDLYRAVSNVVAVSSDLYAVSILVKAQGAGGPERTWRYLAVIDRSACRRAGDMPSVRMFSRVD
jgi:hypothetical protein